MNKESDGTFMCRRGGSGAYTKIYGIEPKDAAECFAENYVSHSCIIEVEGHGEWDVIVVKQFIARREG